MKKIILQISLFVTASCSGAFAQLGDSDTVSLDKNIATGTIKDYGPSRSSKIGLDNNGSISYLCEDSFSKGISRLANMMVRVNGIYFESEKCLKGTAYHIIKMPSGRDAIVGQLSEKSKSYMIKVSSFDEKVVDYRFRKVPEGLAYYVGKKVIIDAVPVAGDEGFYKIVSYMKHPDQ